VHQLDNKVFDIIDAWCNYEDTARYTLYLLVLFHHHDDGVSMLTTPACQQMHHTSTQKSGNSTTPFHLHCSLLYQRKGGTWIIKTQWGSYVSCPSSTIINLYHLFLKRFMPQLNAQCNLQNAKI
jgi:hypothetical protein